VSVDYKTSGELKSYPYVLVIESSAGELALPVKLSPMGGTLQEFLPPSVRPEHKPFRARIEEKRSTDSSVPASNTVLLQTSYWRVLAKFGARDLLPAQVVEATAIEKGHRMMTDILKSVDELCVENGIDARQLAERSSVDEQRVLAIMLGRWTPSPQERDAIAGVLGVTRDQIAWGHKTPIQHLYGHGSA
jgi:hypothetical protein